MGEGIEIDTIGGMCPVQADGRIDGRPFYFRARGSHWSISVHDKPDGDPLDVYATGEDGWHYEEEYDGPNAGYMSTAEATDFIGKAAELLRNGGETER